MTTDTQLHHDPRTKKQIKDCLYEYLYAPVDRKLYQRIREIIVANSRALASSQTGFMYRNVWYSLEPTKVAPRRKDRLVPALRDRMEEYLTEKAQLNDYEIPYVLGFINAVLNSSDDMQDYLLVFPSPLHPPLKKMIDSCPCGTTRLQPETVEEMQERNRLPIELIKSRLVTNLLLQ